jgi:hypothetical protein
MELDSKGIDCHDQYIRQYLHTVYILVYLRLIYSTVDVSWGGYYSLVYLKSDRFQSWKLPK